MREWEAQHHQNQSLGGASSTAVQCHTSIASIAACVAAGMFLFMWVVVLKVPRGLGAESAAKKFLEVMAMTWAGSQVTKLIRAGLALGMAPAVDAGLGKMCAALGLKGKDQAFAVVVACCLALALALFASVVTLWA